MEEESEVKSLKMAQLVCCKRWDLNPVLSDSKAFKSLGGKRTFLLHDSSMHGRQEGVWALHSTPKKGIYNALD